MVLPARKNAPRKNTNKDRKMSLANGRKARLYNITEGLKD
jgi:hypothetical protein